MPSGRFALLLELLEVDTFLLLGLGWSRLVGSLFGTVSDGNGGIGEDVSSEEDDVGTDLSEFRGSNDQACDGSERLDGPLRVLGQLLSGNRGGSGIDVHIDISVGSVILISVSIYSSRRWTYKEVLDQVITVLLVTPRLGSSQDVLDVLENSGSLGTKSGSSGVGSTGCLESVGFND